MMYLLAVLVPPLYFLLKKRWVAFIVTTFLFCLSFFFYLMVVLAPVALILWALSSVCAVWDLRKALMHEHATIMAEKMVETMRQQLPPPVLPQS